MDIFLGEFFMDNKIDEDISIELANYTEPALNAALMIRRQLDQKNIKGFNKEEFKKRFPSPRKLDIGCGSVSESGWIRLDCDQKCKPDLLMDVQNLLLENNSILVARMNYVLGYIPDPCKALREVWRVLVPGGELHLTNGAPATDIQLMPGVKHCFPKQFWEEITQKKHNLYVPEKESGRWELIEEKYDWSPTATKLAAKLKLPRDIVISTFRNVATNQFIILRKC
jgi:SAM-dependent methyltransferase